MALIESTKDFVQFLLVLQLICAQNNGAMKVDDEEFQNMGTIHSAAGYKQKKNVIKYKCAEGIIYR
jgi:hypothetical protein